MINITWQKHNFFQRKDLVWDYFYEDDVSDYYICSFNNLHSLLQRLIETIDPAIYESTKQIIKIRYYNEKYPCTLFLLNKDKEIDIDKIVFESQLLPQFTVMEKRND